MEGIGLEQFGDFNTAKLFAWLIFGVIGFVVFMYGKKMSSFRKMIIGIALMVYPYFVSGTLSLYLTGTALIAVLYFWKE